jgi:DNA-binding GntR family transcriptional regulator
MTAQVVRALRAEIISGLFGPGRRLVETALAERYGSSRHVVREALQALEGEGLVVTDHFRGRSVIDPNPKEVEGLLMMRISLESLAASLAAHRITSEQARALVEKARLPAAEAPDFASLIEWDIGIHRAIWEIADEPNLTRALEKLVWPVFRSDALLDLSPENRVRMLTTQIEREQTGHAAGHAALVGAIADRNSALARAATVRHFLHSTSGTYSNETASALVAAFPESLVRDQV